MISREKLLVVMTTPPTCARRVRHRRSAVPALALAALTALTLAACSSRTPTADSTAAAGQGNGSASNATPQGPAKIALVAGGPNVFFDPWGESATTAQQQYSIPTVTYVVPPTQTFETAVQITTLNGLVSQGYNGMAVFPDGAEAIRPTYSRMAASGVSVVDITGCSKQPTAALFCVATDVEAAAYAQAKLVIEKMGGKGNLVFLAGEPTDPNTVQREDGINKAIAETNGAVTLLQVVAGIDSPAAATPAIQSLLAGSADQIDGIVSTSYYPSVAGAEIWSNNPQYQRIVFAAADNSPQVMQAIQSGAIYGSMFQDPLGQGTISAFMLNKIISEGCTVKDDAPWTTTSLTNKLLATGFEFVDSSNVADFEGKTYGLPDETKKVLDTVPQFLNCP